MIAGLTIRIIQVLKVIRVEEGQNKKKNADSDRRKVP